jgi:glycosyltransferase involved in cell wall biosynthesis
LRIVRIRHLFFPDLPKDYFYELSVRQAEKGHVVHIITWSRNGKSSVEKISENFYVHRLSGLNFSFGKIQHYPFLPTLPFEIERINPDIIHAESHLFLPSVQALLQAKQMGTPSIVTVHGVFAKRDFAVNFLQKLYLHSIGLLAFKLANKIVCLTNSDATSIANLGVDTQKIVIVPNGVDTQLFKPNSNEDKRLVVWVGRFVQEKGVEYLIKAAKIVSEKSNNNITFLLIGYGPLKPALIKMASENGLLGKVVEFAPPRPREEIVEILDKTSLFVCPSLKEGMPLALLEAMACGNCVIGSDISGINDLINHRSNGFLVPPQDPAALAEAILELSSNESLRTKLGSAARQVILQKYSLNMTIDNLEQAYCSIC